MAPAAVPALAQSESKTRFFQRLSLRDDSKGDKDLYAAMKREAVDGRKRLIENESPTSPINETSTHAEILRIYQRASPETRAVYNLGKDTDGAEEENWIIRWLLWHCFRYRDQRNNRNRGGSTTNGHNSGEEDESSGATSSTTPDNEAESSHARSSSNRRHDFWDPVRNSWQAQSP